MSSTNPPSPIPIKSLIRMREVAKSILVIFICCIFAFSFSVVPSTVRAANPTIGFLGDSNTDEYRADDNRAGGSAYANTTLSWGELLVNKRGFDAGVWGSWGEPRRSGYAYNWARSAATAASMISSGQHTGLAAQIAAGQVQYVIIYIGTNDFHSWNGTYDEVYSGSLSGTALQTKINTIVTNITTAVDTLKAAGPAKIILVNFPDPGTSPAFMMNYPSAIGRARVSDAIVNVNVQLATLAASRGIVLADLYHFGSTLLSRADASGNIIVGNEAISSLLKGDEPHHFQLGDSVGHLGTVGSGLLANFFLKALADGYGIPVTQFSDAEILANAGIVVSTPTPTLTETNTTIATLTGAETTSVSPTPTNTATFTPTYTDTATSTLTPTPTGAATETATVESTLTPSATNTATSTATKTATAKPSFTPTATRTPTRNPTRIVTATVTKTPTRTPTRTPTPRPSATPTATRTPTALPTSTAMPTATATATNTPTALPTATASATPTPTSIPTATAIPTVTATATNTPTALPTATPTNTATATVTRTPTPPPSLTPTNIPTSTSTPVPTRSIRLVSRPNSGTQTYAIFDGMVENGVFTEVTSPRFTYTAGWTAYPNQGRNASPVRGTSTAGQTITFTTTATTLVIWTYQDPQMGSLDIYVDNVLKLSYNGFLATGRYVDLNVPLQ